MGVSAMSKHIDPEERERKRLHVLEVAAAEFARLGFDQANINVIAELAGIGKGTIYLYAPSKERLFLDVLHEIGTQTHCALDESIAASSSLPIEDRLRNLLEAFTLLAHNHPDFIRLQASALFSVNRRFQDAMAALLREVVLQLRHIFAGAEDRGALRAVSPDWLAVLLLGIVQTFALLPEALGIEDGATGERNAFLVDVLWQGLSPVEAKAERTH